jgi:hypothetical protein
MNSGSGISHIERATAGTHAFQIQFDPGFDTTINEAPGYTDYRAGTFTPPGSTRAPPSPTSSEPKHRSAPAPKDSPSNAWR